jgi:AcrR family transcriptional regulator
MDSVTVRITNSASGLGDELTDSKTMRLPGQRDPERTRRSILEAATNEFVAKGFAGASVNEIADRAHVNKRMLYHYFGKKEELYVAVLERVYIELRVAQTQLKLTDLPPVEAIKKLVLFTWNYYLEHPELLSLLGAENLMHGKYAARSPRMKEVNLPLREVIQDVLRKGQEEGLFRDNIDAFQLYLTVAGLASQYVSARYTMSSFTGEDLTSEAQMQRRIEHIIDVVLRYLRP